MDETRQAQNTAADGPRLRLHVMIRGAVQGVGFRPFIYRLATDLGLAGWVQNTPQGVAIEAEGCYRSLQRFLLCLEREKPPRASIDNLESSFLDAVGYTGFAIRHSDETGEKAALLLPDIATCAECVQEICDPSNRRYLYPFTNCTNCGPRFSIIEALPYDRCNTSMKVFAMCAACQGEYHNPHDRRFHAQPNACPECGPHLELWDEAGTILASHHNALLRAADAIRQGRIVAMKGLGGFQLLVDARNEQAVLRLRKRKQREEKPFAVLYPDLEAVHRDGEVSPLEARLLRSPEAPIVLLPRKDSARGEPGAVTASVAPQNPYLGVMLPYTPLHHLLMCELRGPVVATSGNLSNEPMCTEERTALTRLRGIADVWLVHNRPIVQHVDDSVVRAMSGRELVLRRARGYAPLPVLLNQDLPPMLAVGAHLKNTTALTAGRHVFLSQHIGDLETPEAFEAFQKIIRRFQTVYNLQPRLIACDAHPDYLSTKYAKEGGVPIALVQHHHAHVLACMADNHLQGRVLGVAWDGSGYGLDGTVWGGEFLLVTDAWYRRVGHLRAFRLPGGEKAIKEPRRTALGALHEIFGESVFERDDLRPVSAFSAIELRLLRRILLKRINTPVTSSAGRLFDAVASLLGLRQKVNFEGQAAMALEFAIADEVTEETYPFLLQPCGLHLAGGAPMPGPAPLDGLEAQDPTTEVVVNWEPLLRAIIDDVQAGVCTKHIAAKFHNTLVETMVAMAERIGERRVVLTGGCFQNKYLTERAVHRLTAQGFRPYWHQRVPPNDGGIALGQAVAASARIKE